MIRTRLVSWLHGGYCIKCSSGFFTSQTECRLVPSFPQLMRARSFCENSSGRSWRRKVGLGACVVTVPCCPLWQPRLLPWRCHPGRFQPSHEAASLQWLMFGFRSLGRSGPGRAGHCRAVWGVQSGLGNPPRGPGVWQLWVTAHDWLRSWIPLAWLRNHALCFFHSPPTLFFSLSSELSV